MKVRIYLDWSDYEVFSCIEKNKKVDPWILDLYIYLQKKRKSGDIDIRYSKTIFDEAFRPAFDSISKESRVVRARTIENLCGTNCFLPPEQIILNEYKTGLPAPASNKGEWISEKDVKSLERHLDLLNPTEYDKFDNYMMKVLINDMKSKLPKKQKTELKRTLRQTSSKPKRLIKSYIKKIKSGKPSQICEVIYENTIQLPYYGDFIEGLQSDLDNLRQGQSISDWSSTFKQTLIQKFCGSIQSKNLDSLNLWTVVHETYLKQKIRDKKDVKKSDLADIYHAFYLPYCDLFRCDKNMAHILRKEDKVVPKLKTIRNRIEEIQNQKRQ